MKKIKTVNQLVDYIEKEYLPQATYFQHGIATIVLTFIEDHIEDLEDKCTEILEKIYITK